jgi:hypothetical protein
VARTPPATGGDPCVASLQLARGGRALPETPPDGPVELPPTWGRPARLIGAAAVTLVALLQFGVGLQVGRPGPVVGGVVLLGVAAVLAVGRGKRTTVGRGGIHAPRRVRQRELPWSSIASLQARTIGGGRVRLLVQQTGHPLEAAVPVATLGSADAERLLPRVRALAEANDVPVHDT